jgi:hypothetical protein
MTPPIVTAPASLDQRKLDLIAKIVAIDDPALLESVAHALVPEWMRDPELKSRIQASEADYVAGKFRSADLVMDDLFGKA